MLNKMAILKFDRTTFGEKGHVRGVGGSYPPIFLVTKKGTRTFDLRFNAPSPDFLGPWVWYDHP